MGFLADINKLSEKEEKEKMALDFLNNELNATATSFKNCVNKTKEKYPDLHLKTQGYLFSSATPFGKLLDELNEAKESKPINYRKNT